MTVPGNEAPAWWAASSARRRPLSWCSALKPGRKSPSRIFGARFCSCQEEAAPAPSASSMRRGLTPERMQRVERLGDGEIGHGDGHLVAELDDLSAAGWAAIDEILAEGLEDGPATLEHLFLATGHDG